MLTRTLGCFAESHTTRVETEDLKNEGPFEQADGVCEGDCEGS